jgi:ubiquinone/menaquinone biosynthesis C-methylase UbiE
MDAEAVKRKYRRNARFYDWATAAPTRALRRSAVQRLRLSPGERVLDLGCGTGLSLPLLREGVGDSGRVYGVELSPEMLAQARARALGWANVRLLEANAEELELDEAVDAILCFFTHDIMVSPTAIPRALRFLKPRGRIAAAGVKLVHGWRGCLVNPITVAYSLPAVTTWDAAGAFEPYAALRELVNDFEVEERLLGSHYLVWGASGV